MAKANPHEFSINVVGDINVPPPGSDKRKLYTPSAAGPAAAVPAELHSHRPYYHRWANILFQLTEIATDAHTHIIIGTLTTDTSDRIFTSLPKSAGNILEQPATLLNSPMFFLSEQLSDYDNEQVLEDLARMEEVHCPAALWQTAKAALWQEWGGIAPAMPDAPVTQPDMPDVPVTQPAMPDAPVSQEAAAAGASALASL